VAVVGVVGDVGGGAIRDAGLVVGVALEEEGAEAALQGAVVPEVNVFLS
jgi:hypothetical protein